MEDFDINKPQFGALSSNFSILYGIGKFCVSIMTDSLDAGLLFGFGVFGSGLCVYVMEMCQSALSINLVWSVHGFLQGFGWPAISKLLIDLYPSNSVSSLWSYLTTAGNIGNVLGPYAFDKMYGLGWRNVCKYSGSLLVVVSVISTPVLFFNSKRSPSVPSKSTKSLSLTKIIGMFRNMSYVRVIISDVLTYAITKSISDWSIMYFGQKFQYDNSRLTLVWIELCGVLGSLCCGIICNFVYSSYVKKKDVQLNENVIRQTIIFWSYVVALLSMCIHIIGCQYNSLGLSLSSLLMISFMTNMPKTLYGIQARKIVNPDDSSIAGAVIGLTGQCGAYVAGYPIGVVISVFGWQGYSLSILSFISLWFVVNLN